MSHVIQRGKSNALNMEVSLIAQLIKNPPAMQKMGLPVGSVGKESASSAGDMGLIPGQEEFLEKGMAIPF